MQSCLSRAHPKPTGHWNFLLFPSFKIPSTHVAPKRWPSWGPFESDCSVSLLASLGKSRCELVSLGRHSCTLLLFFSQPVKPSYNSSSEGCGRLSWWFWAQLNILTGGQSSGPLRRAWHPCPSCQSPELGVTHWSGRICLVTLSPDPWAPWKENLCALISENTPWHTSGLFY